MTDSPLGLTGLLDELLADARDSNDSTQVNQDRYVAKEPESAKENKPPIASGDALLSARNVPPISARSNVPSTREIAVSPKQAAASTALMCGEMEALLANLEANRCKDIDDLELARGATESSDLPSSDWSLAQNPVAAAAGLPREEDTAVDLALPPLRSAQAGRGGISGIRTLDLNAAPVARPWPAAQDSQIAAFASQAQDANESFRNYMEDGETIADPMCVTGRLGETSSTWGLFAVYDGHGGREAVNYCESTLLQLVTSEMENLSQGKDVNSVLTSVFSKIDSQLAMFGAWSHGCTCTVCLVHRDLRSNQTTLRVANVGDSRAVLLSDAGTLRVSVDHRPDNPDETRRVQEEGGRVRAGRVGGKLAISRSLGDHHLKSQGVSGVPDICVCGVARGHILITASDGVWDVVTDEEVAELVEASIREAEARSSVAADIVEWMRANASQKIVDRAKELGSRDNILVQMVFF